VCVAVVDFTASHGVDSVSAVLLRMHMVLIKYPLSEAPSGSLVPLAQRTHPDHSVAQHLSARPENDKDIRHELLVLTTLAKRYNTTRYQGRGKSRITAYVRLKTTTTQKIAPTLDHMPRSIVFVASFI
jgi:hypothetical protein